MFYDISGGASPDAAADINIRKVENKMCHHNLLFLPSSVKSRLQL